MIGQKEQVARVEKAKNALQRGKWEIIPTEFGWVVKTDTQNYSITADPAKGTPVSCTCIDYSATCRKLCISCKHMAGVEMALSSGQVGVDTTSLHRKHRKRLPMPNTYPEVQEQLLIPFPTNKLKFRPQYVPRRKEDNKIYAKKGNMLLVVYADPRAYIDRLNEVCAGEWEKDILLPLHAGTKLIMPVKVTIMGVVQTNVGESDVGDDNAGTIAYAQGYKRACADHGLGRYLYELKIWVPFTCEDGKKIDWNEQDAINQLPRWASLHGYLAMREEEKDKATPNGQSS